MNKVMLSAAITLTVFEIVSYFLNAQSSHFDWSGFGMAQFLCALFAFVPGLILGLIRATNEIGKGILLGIGIALLIGFAVCSNNKIL